jgi:hypothetical protein
MKSEDEMGREFSMYGSLDSAYKGLAGKPEGKNHLEDAGIDGRIILECILNKREEDVDWICLAQDRV